MRGVVQGDEDEQFIADVNGGTVRLPRGSSDAALAPYHVDRSKLFVLERLDPLKNWMRTGWPVPSNIKVSLHDVLE